MSDRRGALLQASLLRFVRRGAWTRAERLLASSHPADVAEVLGRMTATERRAAFDLVRSEPVQSEVLALLEPVARAELLAELKPEVTARFLDQMSTDDAALVLRELPRDLSDEILGALGERSKQIESLLDYPADRAGAIMSPEYMALSEDLTATEAIERLREMRDVDAPFYAYVVDDRHHLVGVLSLRELITQPGTTRLRDTMIADPIRVTTDTDQEEVARVVARYDLLAVPVVDASSQLVGVVTVDDVIDVINEEAAEDILKLAGTTVEEVESPSIWRGARIRLPWLGASFVGGGVGMLVLQQAERVFAANVELVFFLPIILGMAGNAASQCSMVVVQGLAVGRFDTASIGRLLRHELGTAILLAVLFAAAVGGLGVVLTGQPVRFPLVVSLGMFCTMLIATSVGTVLPLLFQRLGADPAVASGPFITTSTDVLGIGIFLLVASSLLA